MQVAIYDGWKKLDLIWYSKMGPKYGESSSFEIYGLKFLNLIWTQNLESQFLNFITSNYWYEIYNNNCSIVIGNKYIRNIYSTSISFC